MTNSSDQRARRPRWTGRASLLAAGPLALALALALALSAGCTRVPNPFFIDEAGDEVAEDTAGTADTGDLGTEADESESESADGEGTDTDSTSGSDSSSGSTESDSTSDTDSGSSETEECPVATQGCPCGPTDDCFPGLICVVGVCLSEEPTCDPADRDVDVELNIDWGEVATGTSQTNCLVNTNITENKVELNLGFCGNDLSGGSVVLRPGLDVPNVDGGFIQLTAVKNGSNRTLRFSLPELELVVVDDESLAAAASLLTWAPEPAPSQCPITEVGCGEQQRIAIDNEGELVFDQNAKEVQVGRWVWVKEAVDECGAQHFLAGFAY